MPLKHHVAQLTQAFDHLLWADLCEAAELIGLTPSELVSSILEVCHEVRDGAHPLQAFVAAEVARRMNGAQVVGEMTGPVGPVPETRRPLAAQAAPPAPDEDGPSADELAALETAIRELTQKIRGQP